MHLLIALLAVSAGTETSATEFTIDGATYLKEYVWDDSGTSTETLYVKNGSGDWTFVASLYSDLDGNWTGRIGNDFYADQWDETLGDYVVVIGTALWPTWYDFDAALQALHFWDDGGVFDDVIMIDDGIVFYDIAVFALGTGGEGTQVQSTEARPGQKGLLNALSNAPNAKARVALLTALTNPTPKSVFPALAKPGKSPRK
jgi:hypothetical protein